jgi:hypothetical protein
MAAPIHGGYLLPGEDEPQWGQSACFTEISYPHLRQGTRPRVRCEDKLKPQCGQTDATPRIL